MAMYSVTYLECLPQPGVRYKQLARDRPAVSPACLSGGVTSLSP